jgi:hypothetical protein
VLLEVISNIKKAMGLTPMVFFMQIQKSHGDHLAHPWLPVTMLVGSGTWMSPTKIKEEKEAAKLHCLSLLSMIIYLLTYLSEMSRGNLFWVLSLYGNGNYIYDGGEDFMGFANQRRE